MKMIAVALAVMLGLIGKPSAENTQDTLRYADSDISGSPVSYHPDTGLDDIVVTEQEIAESPSFFDYMNQEPAAAASESETLASGGEEDARQEDLQQQELPAAETASEPAQEQVPAESWPVEAPASSGLDAVVADCSITKAAALEAIQQDEALFWEIYALAEGNPALSCAEKSVIYNDFDKILYNRRFAGYTEALKNKTSTVQIYHKVNGGSYIYAEYLVSANVINYYFDDKNLSAGDRQRVVGHEIKHLAQNNNRFCVLRDGWVEMADLAEYMQSPDKIQLNGMYGIYGIPFHEAYLDQIYEANHSFYGEIYRLYADTFGKDVIYESVYSPQGMSVLANRMIGEGVSPEQTVDILTRLDLHSHAKFYPGALEGTQYTSYQQLQQAVMEDMAYIESL